MYRRAWVTGIITEYYVKAFCSERNAVNSVFGSYSTYSWIDLVEQS